MGSDAGASELALPALGSFLWGAGRSTPDLQGCLVSNRHFIEAVHALVFVQDGNVRRAVDYRNLGAEELGSVYEGLLELHPEINPDAGSFELKIAAGNERKTSGSYYTPDSLVQCLLDSALEPVVEDATKGKTNEEAAAAILKLKVCDPASGSGHFIIAAAHRMARRLALLRSGGDEPPPSVYRTALRDVIGHCLYAVDINPMAAELCKVNLWIEAMEPGKPLSFLDHHIRCGNSLLGTTPELIAGGIPDDAFQPIEGDDKEACSFLKKRNKGEREGIGGLFAKEDAALRDKLRQAAAAIDEIEDDSPEQIHRKETAFKAAQQNRDFQKANDLANLWCAAFVIKKRFPESATRVSSALSDSSAATETTVQGGLFGGTEEVATAKSKKAKAPARSPSETPSGITTKHLREFVEGRTINEGVMAEARLLTEQYQFFHWHLAFPEVFQRLEVVAPQDSNGWKCGFSVILGNPPWERVKLAEDEWFASARPDIAGAIDASKRKEMIAALGTENPQLHAQFLKAQRKSDAESQFVRSAGRYPLCGRGDINTYSIFAELSRAVVSRHGRVGLVLQAGIATDKTTSQFFEDLVAARSLVSLFSFDNQEALFPGVKRSMRFCLLTLTGPAAPFCESIRFVFYAKRLEQIHDPNRTFTLTSQDIEMLNPNTRTCPVFQSRRDCDLVMAIYHRIPVLVKERAGVNEWSIAIRRILDMNKREVLQLCTIEEPAEADSSMLPVCEAKLIGQLNHRDATYDGKRVREVSMRELGDPLRKTRPRYWISRKDVAARLMDHWKHEWLLVWQDVTDVNTMSRTVSTTLVPFWGTDFTLRVGFPERNPILCASAFLANFNSFVFDYISRQKIGGTHLSDYIVKQLPALPPVVYAQPCAWASQGQTLHTWLMSRVLELTYTAWDLQPFAQDCGWSGPPFRWDEERRFLLRCELDAAYFHLYGLNRDDSAYVMDTFPIVKRKDEEKFATYRTKDSILAIYDAMAEAIRNGRRYQTRLDPPLFSPLVTHLPRLPKGRRVELESPEDYVYQFILSYVGRLPEGAEVMDLAEGYGLLCAKSVLKGYLRGYAGAEIADAWTSTFTQKVDHSLFRTVFNDMMHTGVVGAEKVGDRVMATITSKETIPHPEWVELDVSLLLGLQASLQTATIEGLPDTFTKREALALAV